MINPRTPDHICTFSSRCVNCQIKEPKIAGSLLYPRCDHGSDKVTTLHVSRGPMTTLSPVSQLAIYGSVLRGSSPEIDRGPRCSITKRCATPIRCTEGREPTNGDHTSREIATRFWQEEGDYLPYCNRNYRTDRPTNLFRSLPRSLDLENMLLLM